jgi:hypothetical protein
VDRPLPEAPATLFTVPRNNATMTPSPSSSGLLPLPLPGSPSSRWQLYRARFADVFHSADVSVLASFWLFGRVTRAPPPQQRTPGSGMADDAPTRNPWTGLINNVLYVIILSAAQDLVGNIPKGKRIEPILENVHTTLTTLHPLPQASSCSPASSRAS